MRASRDAVTFGQEPDPVRAMLTDETTMNRVGPAGGVGETGITWAAQSALVDWRRSAAALAVALAFGVGPVAPAAAATLGELSMRSDFGQPLVAEIELRDVRPDEAERLVGRIASRAQYRDMGLEFPEALDGARVSIQRGRQGQSVLRIATTRPVTAPVVDMLIALGSSRGQYLRNYQLRSEAPADPAPAAARTPIAPIARPFETPASPAAAQSGGDADTRVEMVRVDPQAAPPGALQPRETIRIDQAPAEAPRSLLDRETPAPLPGPAWPAPETIATPTPSRAVPASPAFARRDEAPAPSPTPRRGAAASAAPSLPVAAPDGETRVVAEGETASSIVAAVKPADATLEQAVVAFYEANRQAFGGNVHRLRAGASVRLPDAAAIAAVPASAARERVRSDWASHAASPGAWGAPRVLDTPADGSIGAVARAPKAPAGDRLALGGASDPRVGSPRERRDAERVAQVAHEAAMAEAQSRIAELERNAQGLRELILLKDRQLASVEAGLRDLRQTPGAAGTAAATPVAMSSTGPLDPPAARPAVAAPRAIQPMPAPPPTEWYEDTTVQAGAAAAVAALLIGGLFVMRRPKSSRRSRKAR